MYCFDLHQQFGWRDSRSRRSASRALACRRTGGAALLMLRLYLANVIFAFSYNVGDTHVFYLPSHLIVALLMAPGRRRLVTCRRIRLTRPAVRLRWPCALAIAYAGARPYLDYPALDRSGDHRPTEVLDGIDRGPRRSSTPSC